MSFTESRMRFDMGDVFGDCIGLVRKNAINFYLLSAIGVGIPNFFVQLFQRQTFAGLTTNSAANVAFNGAMYAKMGSQFVEVYLFATLAGLVGVVVKAMIIVAAVEADGDQPTTLSTLFSRGLRFFPACLGLTIIWYVGYIFGLILLVIPGVIISVAWSVILPAYASEQLTLGGALSRSAKLTKGLRWSVLGIWLLYFLVGAILGGALAAAIGLAFGSGLSIFAGQGSPLGGALGTTVVATLFVPFQTCLMVAIFNALRRAKEQVTPRSIIDAFT